MSDRAAGRRLGGHVVAARIPNVKWRAVAGAMALTLVAGCAGAESAPAEILWVVASSELADLRPVLDEAAAATGVRVELHPVDTLDGTDWFASAPFEKTRHALWFSSNRYLALRPELQTRLGPTTPRTCTAG
jgi:Ca-activated chloride channel homolog